MAELEPNAMIDEVITKVGNSIRDTFYGFFNLTWIPEIVFWYWWLFLLFLFCGMIIWFFGWSKIVRIAASMAFLFAAIFVAGGHYMARRLKAREKPPAKTPPPKPPEHPVDGGWPWKW